MNEVYYKGKLIMTYDFSTVPGELDDINDSLANILSRIDGMAVKRYGEREESGYYDYIEVKDKPVVRYGKVQNVDVILEDDNICNYDGYDVIINILEEEETMEKKQNVGEAKVQEDGSVLIETQDGKKYSIPSEEEFLQLIEKYGKKVE